MTFKDKTEAFQSIIEAAGYLGWEIAIDAPKETPDSPIRGLIVGTKEYLDETLKDSSSHVV